MASLQDAVTTFANQLATKLERFVEDISEVEVRTFTTPEDQVKVLIDGTLDDLKGQVQLRAYTKISLDGDTVVCVPEKGGVVDTTVWNLHQTMVTYAMQNRATMLKTIGDAAAATLGALKKANEA